MPASADDTSIGPRRRAGSVDSSEKIQTYEAISISTAMKSSTRSMTMVAKAAGALSPS